MANPSRGGINVAEAVNCMKCRHFFVTWDPRAPRGCQAMGFKGMMMPSQQVLVVTGKPCQLFEEKGNPPAPPASGSRGGRVG